MPKYIYEQPNWPDFTWDNDSINPLLTTIRHRQGRLIGRLEGLGFDIQNQTLLDTLTLDIIKSSEIEGESLNPEQVRSSIANRLNIKVAGLIPSDSHTDGVVAMALDATQHYQTPLSIERLCNWQADLLIGDPKAAYLEVKIGAFRDDGNGPMEVVSGPPGKERIHFEAPAAIMLEDEIKKFITWANQDTSIDMIIKSAIAHLWFVTLHPFGDGNGRIARAISDYYLAKSENSTKRFYSMSAQIRLERNAYYNILEKTQKDGLDITAWLTWFLECLDRAFDRTEEIVSKSMMRARFWEHHKNTAFNARQKKMLDILLDNFFGKLTAAKWAKMTQTSHDTALRDINELIDMGILEKTKSGGRSTSYALKPLAKCS